MPVFTDSSAILAAEYYDTTSTLRIWFAHNQRAYDYYGVPRQVYENLCVAASKGEYFNDYIRDVYGR